MPLARKARMRVSTDALTGTAAERDAAILCPRKAGVDARTNHLALKLCAASRSDLRRPPARGRRRRASGLCLPPLRFVCNSRRPPPPRDYAPAARAGSSRKG